jgi:hypothetical protein
MSTHKDIRLATTWMDCSMLTSSLLKPAHALNHWNKNEICQVPFLLMALVGKVASPSQVAYSSHISWSSDSLQKCSNCTVCGAIVAISPATHGGYWRSPSQSASYAFLCWKYGYLSFISTQKSRSSCSGMYSRHPTHKQYKSQMLTLSISILYLPTVSSYYYNPTSAKDLRQAR